MDVEELLNFKPDKEPKRHREDEQEAPGSHKRRRIAGNDDRILQGEHEQSGSYRALELPDDVAMDSEAGLSKTDMKQLVLNFEKKHLRNQELRIKFPEMPEKFMDSEVELNEVIHEMHMIATQPQFYPTLVELNAVHSLLALLAHDNTDICTAALNLLQEMTDLDDDEAESREGTEALVDALVDGQIGAVLVEAMDRLDETAREEAEGVHNALAIVENMTEIRPDFCVTVAKDLVPWLLRRIRAKMPFDANKLYASEILSILLQNHEENRKLLGDLDGTDALLQQLAYFKRHDPSSLEETEMMENLFNALCSCLLYAPNRDRFLKGEGLQLMNLILREKKQSRAGALKVVDYATNGPEGADNCNKFVDILGLRTLFPLFMHTPKKHKKNSSGGASPEEHEEHVCSIIASLMKHSKASQQSRLIGKFTENDFEKIDRLMELHFKYLERVQNVDAALEKQKAENTDEPLDEDELYMKRLDGGLFTLQLIDYIMLDLCHTGPPAIKQRVMQILNLRGGSIKHIRNIMREYAGNLGDGDESQRRLEQERILDLVNRF